MQLINRINEENWFKMWGFEIVELVVDAAKRSL